MACALALALAGCEASPGTERRSDAGVVDAGERVDGAADAEVAADAASGDAAVPTCTERDLPVPGACGPATACRAVLEDGEAVVRCVEGRGTKGQAEKCADHAECAPGFGCVPASDELRVCAAYCDALAPCEGESALCVRYALGNGEGEPVTGVGHICTTSCNPFNYFEVCPANTDCEVVFYEEQVGSSCIGTGEGAVGDACTEDPDCVPGATCRLVAGDPEGTCRLWCLVDDPGTCPETDCIGFSPPVILEGREFGYCELPESD